MSNYPVAACADWLRRYLSPFPTDTCNDPDHEVALVYRAAKQAGFSRRLVRAAKNQLHLVVTSRVEHSKRVFYWRLP